MPHWFSNTDPRSGGRRTVVPTNRSFSALAAIALTALVAAVLGAPRVALAAAESGAPADAVTAAAPAPAVPPPSGGVAERPRSSYRLGAGDLLHVDVFDDPTLSGDYSVGDDGRIVFPLIGPTAVGGLTADEAKVRIAAALDKDYLRAPNVSAWVKEFRSQKVSILGNVSRPGTYYLKDETRLFDVLSMAAGTAPQQGEIRKGQTARIVRRDPSGTTGGVRTIPIDLHDLIVLGRPEANVLVLDGDTIYVEQSEEIHVVGEVKKPGSYPFERGMTVLKAVSVAGGATKKGSLRNAVVKRIREGKETKLRLGEEGKLEPDDVVEVPLSFW